jgi:hypothetical protein
MCVERVPTARGNVVVCLRYLHLMWRTYTCIMSPLFSYTCNCRPVKVKVKSSQYRPKLAERVGRGIALLFLDLGARRGWVVSTRPRPLYLRERHGTHCTGGWVGLRACLDVCEKSRPPPGFDPRTVQLVAIRYTD